MSWEALAWAEKQQTGSTIAKAVLIALADAHNQHHGHCFVRVGVIATTVEASERTVQRALKRLEEELGLIRRVESFRANGSQECNSFVFPGLGKDYPVSERPARKGDRAGCQNVTPPSLRVSSASGVSECHPTPRQNVTPSTFPSSNLLPPHELRSCTPKQPGASEARRMPEGWQPPRADWLPPKARECAAQWPEGAYETEAEAFACYWQGEAGPRAQARDWNKRWAKWIVRQTPKMLRDAKVVRFSEVKREIASIGPDGRRTPSAEEEAAVEGEGEEAAAVRRHLHALIGPISYQSWFARCAVRVDDGFVTVAAPSNTIADEVRDRFAPHLRGACDQVLGSTFEGLRVVVQPARSQLVRVDARALEARLG